MSEKKAKNYADWKKRVKAEYFRLLQAKKTKKDDDNVFACTNNQKKLYGMFLFYRFMLCFILDFFLYRKKRGRTQTIVVKKSDLGMSTIY